MPKCQATSDMRCCAQIATISMWVTIEVFLMRSGGSFHTLRKMDFEGSATAERTPPCTASPRRCPARGPRAARRPASSPGGFNGTANGTAAAPAKPAGNASVASGGQTSAAVSMWARPAGYDPRLHRRRAQRLHGAAHDGRSLVFGVFFPVFIKRYGRPSAVRWSWR